MHVARLAMLEGAACALLRELAQERGPEAFDGFTLRCTQTFDGATVLDLEYTRGGRGMAGESL